MPHRVILHASDPHFGYPLRAELAEAFVHAAHDLAPDLLVITGDLTQRALHRQFAAARHWLDRLPRPLLVVPGNHDVPLLQVWERFRSPLGRYRQHIANDVEPVYEDDGLLAIGLCSARPNTTQHGWLLPEQLERTRALVEGRRPGQAVAVAVHHHFYPVRGTFQKAIGDAEALLRDFDAWGVDLVLAGHSHCADVQRVEGGLLVAQAGTVTSTRGKGPDRGRSSYYVIHLHDLETDITRWQWDKKGQVFRPVLKESFRRRSAFPILQLDLG